MSFDFECSGYLVTAEVDECRDAYGTGDSPTLYDVELLSIYDEDGNEVDERSLSSFVYDSIIDEAIQEFKG
jgi:hypothetical protein